MITITAIDASTVLEAVRMQLAAWPDIATLQGPITRGEPINQDSNKCPWIGVYPVGEDYPSRTLGFGAGYRTQQIGVVVVVQASSRDSGQVCQDQLEGMKQAAISALLSDPSLGGTVDVIDQFSVRYATAAQQAGEPYFQSAAINFTGLKPVGASGG